MIEGTDISDSNSDNQAEFSGKITIPFKNENIAALNIKDNGSENILAIVPNLITSAFIKPDPYRRLFSLINLVQSRFV